MRNVLLLFVLLTLRCSCKRWQKQYPEDVERTILSPLARISNKWWYLQSVVLNDKEMKDSVLNEIGDYRIQFVDGKISQHSETRWFFIEPSSISGGLQTTWGFIQDETYLTMANGSSSTWSIVPGCFIKQGDLDPYWKRWTGWQILKLSASDCKLKNVNTLNDSTIIVELSINK